MMIKERTTLRLPQVIFKFSKSKIYSDEDSILDQIYDKQILRRFKILRGILKEVQHSTKRNSYNWSLVLIQC